MVFVRITTSIPKGDKEFCEQKNLSPAKLLQERICQIRDEENPILRNNLQEERQRNENLLKKISFLSDKVQKLSEVLPEDIFNKILSE